MKIEKLAIVDVAHIFHRTWHAGADKALSFAYQETLERVRNIRDQNKYGAIICAIDCPPYHRSTMFPRYKGERAERPPEMVAQYKRLQDKLRKEFHVWGVNGYEADDVIGTVAHSGCFDELDIYTGDKDLVCLLAVKGVTVVSTTDGTRYDMAAAKAKHGVYPHQMEDYLAIVGDKSDNIPGCPEMGPKRAAELLAHNTVDEFYDMVQAGKTPRGVTPASLQKMIEHEAHVRHSRTLVRLFTDLKLPIEELGMEKQKEQQQPEPEPEEHETTEPEAKGDTEPRTENQPEPPKTKKPQSTPVDDGASIEIRPGLSLSNGQFGLMMKMAVQFNRSGLYSRKFDNESAIFTVMEMGMEIGISPQAACQSFHMIEGKPVPGAHLLIALAEQSSNCEQLYCSEETPTSVTYTTKTRGIEGLRTFTYTLADAEADEMRWAKKTKNRRAMLRKTAGSQAARLWYPGSVLGLYSAEEMGYSIEEDA